MLSFTGGLKVFIALEPCDMRKGFEGLHAAVCEQLKEQVRGGGLFVFANRRRTRLKILYFDGTGLWLMTKALKAIDATLLPVKKFLSRAEALQAERKIVEKASKGSLPLNNEPWSPNKRCR